MPRSNKRLEICSSSDSDADNGSGSDADNGSGSDADMDYFEMRNEIDTPTVRRFYAKGPPARNAARVLKSTLLLLLLLPPSCGNWQYSSDCSAG
jgi:hypothetical protein